MIVNLEKVQLVLLNKAIPTDILEKEIGVPQRQILDLRDGKIELKDLPIATAVLTQKWINEGNFAFGYDYSSLLEEFKADMLEGLIKDKVYIVRGAWNNALEYAPIIDYFYTLREAHAENETVIEADPNLVVREMEKWSNIFND